MRLYDREEVLAYNKYAIGIYKMKDNGYGKLNGHAPTEISSLLHRFLRVSDVKAEILGKRKREVELVVPAKYNYFMAKRQTAKILDAKILKCKDLFVSPELLRKQQRSDRTFPVYQ